MKLDLKSSMDLDEDKILNDPREAAIQAKLMADLAALMPQPPQQEAPQPPEGGGAPSPQDPTGTGGGNIAPGNAPEPGAPGPGAPGQTPGGGAGGSGPAGQV